MADASEMQDRLQEMQGSEEFTDLFSKLVSGGKPGYKTVIEKDKPALKCEKCGKNLFGKEKFCSECGNSLNLTEND